MKKIYLIASLLIGFSAAHPAMAALSGKEVFSKTCTVCHTPGIAGAPRYGNTADWTPRIAKGLPALYQSALKGTAKGMPSKGGNQSLSDDEVRSAVDHMLAAAKLEDTKPEAKAEAKPAAKTVAKAEPKAKPVAKSEPKPVAKVEAKSDPAPAAAPVAAAPATTTPASASTTPVIVPGSDPLSFNRLLKPANKRNLPPPEDGIHDPANDGTHALLAPLSVFSSMPKANAGNRVDWVQAIENGVIKPRADRTDPTAEMLVMDLNVVREVKGSMPNVVYPHKQHTEWLDCSNCHTGIFIPQKGANAISMAAILLGEKCGVCHGKVSFPVSECRKCHSQKKEFNPAPNAAAK
jgi:c(7)-type cytochrome triheme protein